MANRPEPELTIDTSLVRHLLEDQFPALASRELRTLSRGWDNTNFRLGQEFIVRVPHREAAVALLAHEQRCLPAIAERVDLAISVPVHCGSPSDEFPWPWSITPFFEGTEAATASLDNAGSTAEQLGNFFSQLHVGAPRDAPPNPYRGCPLIDRAEPFYNRLSQLGDRVDQHAVRSLFDDAAALDNSTERVWLHGDLHTRNMIVSDGRLGAVIDWGDICAGDRATDLAGAFMLVPDEIATVQRYAGASAADWQRARGWAINFAVIYLSASDDDPIMRAIGSRLMDTLLAN